MTTQCYQSLILSGSAVLSRYYESKGWTSWSPRAQDGVFRENNLFLHLKKGQLEAEVPVVPVHTDIQMHTYMHAHTHAHTGHWTSGKPLSAASFPCGSDSKESACNVGDLHSTPSLGEQGGLLDTPEWGVRSGAWAVPACMSEGWPLQGAQGSGGLWASAEDIWRHGASWKQFRSGLFCLWAVLWSMWILISPARIKPVPPELEGWNLNHWTARDVPEMVFIKLWFIYLIVHLFIHTPNTECQQHAGNCCVLETQMNVWLQHRGEVSGVLG